MYDREADRDAWQLAELLELAGSAESLMDAVDELEMLKGRRPTLMEVVEVLAERRNAPLTAVEVGWAEF